MAHTGLGAATRPASVSLPNPPLLVGLEQCLLCSEHFKDWGERWPLPPHTHGTAQLQVAVPTKGPIGWLGTEGCPSRPPGRCRERAGRRPHQQPPPGHPLHSAHPTPCTWLDCGMPQPRVRGSCYSVPNPVGHRAIYLDVSLPRPPPLPALSTSGNAALYAPSSLSPPGAPGSLRRGSEETGLTPPGNQGPVACSTRGRLQPGPLTPQVLFLLRLP